ncbi:MAG: gliding motility-associated C-terminal domain-containing protein [Bacteroidia bacterium]|nr:gliding motility-associated C-terminal domain-containing protein [Bacteroidia bacterium]
MHLKSIPLINSNRLEWNPYNGWKVDKYVVERINTIDEFEIIGETDGQTFSYIDSTVNCKQTHAYRVKAIGTSFSYSDTSNSKATWENRLPTPNNFLVSVENDTAIRMTRYKGGSYDRSNIIGYSLERYDLNGLKIIDISIDSLSYLDKRVYVDQIGYQYYLRQRDDCGDTSKLMHPSGNILLRNYIVSELDPPGIRWNPYKTWLQGVSYYEVQRQLEDGSFETISTTTDTFYIDDGSQNSCKKNYIYRVTAILNGSGARVSISNYLRIKPQSTLFIPNAFSPNSNGINDVFAPKGQYLYDYHMEIYSIWGEKLYETNDCMGAWDGQFKGEVCEQNVYFYRISARGTDGELYIKSGTFTLLR